MSKILCVYSNCIYSNGEKYTLLNDGVIPKNFNFIIERTLELNIKIMGIAPLRDREFFIIDSDLNEFKLPMISSLLEILPDKTGIIAFYDKEKGILNDCTYLPPPHNAAIYNADGTLRHQLIVPNELLTLGGEGWYIHSTYYADFTSIQGFGVMVTNDHKWPELCFCLYDGTPNLVWTGYQQERR